MIRAYTLNPAVLLKRARAPQCFICWASATVIRRGPFFYAAIAAACEVSPIDQSEKWRKSTIHPGFVEGEGGI